MARSLTRIHFQAFLILLLCLGAAGYAGYLVINDILRSSYQESAAQTARMVADRISGLLSQQRQMLEKNARQPSVVSGLQRNGTAERDRKEDEIKSILPGAVSVHLLPRNSTGAVFSNEKLEPACIKFLQHAVNENIPIPSEFHEIGTPSEHYDMAVPVLDENHKPIGYLLVSFSRAPLQASIEQSLPRGGRLELQQSEKGKPAQTVLNVGDGSNTTVATVASDIGNSRWTLLYQPAEALPLLLSGQRIYYFYLILLAFIAIVIVSFRLYRRTITSVRHDIKSLTRMFKDMREGGVRVDYPMALHEFSVIFDHFRDRAQKLIEEKQKLKDMGLMDHLSQLGNRRHFETRLKELFEASKANGPSSVLMIDIDHFKAVNDKHGHEAGDALIVGFANALRKVVRQTDVLVRLGGDEFCIIYTYAPLEKATVFAERLRKQLPRDISLTKGVIHQIRWTGGLSTMHDKDTKLDDVLWRADEALLRAKESGRNNTKVYDPNAGPPAKKQILVS